MQSDENLKRINRVFHIVHVGVDPKERSEIGLSENSASGFDTKREGWRRKVNKKVN